MNNCLVKQKQSAKKYELLIIYSLIPLILYAAYKNGILLYYKNLVQFVYIVKPLIIIGFSIISGIVLTNIFKNKKINYELILYNLLISLCMSININLYLYSILLIIIDLIYIFYFRKVKQFNYVALAVILISVVSYLISNYTFLNHYEIININSYNFLDFFIGKATGGLGTTNILFIMGSLLFLSFQNYYKKDIAITSVALYLICGLWYIFINHSLNMSLMILCTYSVLFGMIYIAPINKYSPKTYKLRYIYAIIVAFLSFVGIYFLNFVLSIFVAIIIADLIILILCHIKKGK